MKLASAQIPDHVVSDNIQGSAHSRLVGKSFACSQMSITHKMDSNCSLLGASSRYMKSRLLFRAQSAILSNTFISIGQHVQLGIDCAVATVTTTAARPMIEERISGIICKRLYGRRDNSLRETQQQSKMVLM